MCGAAISCNSKLQTCPALLSVEAEYIAMTRTAQEAIWICQLLKDLGYKQTHSITLFGDNKGVISLAGNPSDHPQTKHIASCHYFICFAVSNNTVLLKYISTLEIAAGGLTKELSGPKHHSFIVRDLEV